MKKRTSKLLITVAVLSLIVIGAVIASGLSKKFNSKKTSDELQNNNVLGQLTQSLNNSSLLNTNTVSNTIESTKETVSQKANEVEKEILKTVEMQITTLTQSQIQSVKQQICTDWGIITPQPTKKEG